jgi:glycerophosphoryl diester phosphodiesterase
VEPRPTPFPTGSGPIGMAHRGGAAEQVENSPSAFGHALDVGLRFIETDARATVDGHAVLLHDATLDRTTDRSGAVAALPLSHVVGARLANGDHPMPLVEALRSWPSAVLNVDVKADDAVEPFLRAVEQADAWDRVCAASFSTARLRRLRQRGGGRLATSLGTAEVVRLTLRLPFHAARRACAVQVPASAGVVPLVTRGFVDHAHSLGLAVHVWTVNDEPEMRRLLDLGVDAIVTDRPSVLAGLLAGPAASG